MYRVLGNIFSCLQLIILFSLYVLPSSAEASSCVITSINENKVTIGGNELNLPALIQECCSLGKVKTSVSACFTNGNKCFDIKPGHKINDSTACDKKARISKLSWLLNSLKGEPGKSLAMQRNANESNQLIGFPYGDIIYSNFWYLPTAQLNLKNSNKFQIVNSKEEVILSESMTDDYLGFSLSKLKSDASYKWFHTFEGRIISQGEFYLLPQNELAELRTTYEIFLRDSSYSESNALSLAMDLYDENLISNAYQIILIIKKNKENK